jgi:hypothetical protein
LMLGRGKQPVPCLASECPEIACVPSDRVALLSYGWNFGRGGADVVGPSGSVLATDVCRRDDPSALESRSAPNAPAAPHGTAAKSLASWARTGIEHTVNMVIIRWFSTMSVNTHQSGTDIPGLARVHQQQRPCQGKSRHRWGEDPMNSEELPSFWGTDQPNWIRTRPSTCAGCGASVIAVPVPTLLSASAVQNSILSHPSCYCPDHRHGETKPSQA